MDALELKDTTHFLRDFGDFPWSIFLYLMKSRLLLLDFDGPINPLP